jgi:hypothetical protein
VKTATESFVGLLGVDQSVLLLKSGNDISQSDISVEEYNFIQATKWNNQYSYDPRYTSTYNRDFASASLAFLSNAKKEFSKWFL